uniref:Uncharacterized protein n=1 Tax=Leersia perrieri TaxID=77586 RepID=A0A0D9XDN5_9ORYZ
MHNIGWIANYSLVVYLYILPRVMKSTLRSRTYWIDYSFIFLIRAYSFCWVGRKIRLTKCIKIVRRKSSVTNHDIMVPSWNERETYLIQKNRGKGKITSERTCPP